MKIALSMIVKGNKEEPTTLRRALESVRPCVDGVFITLTGTPEEQATIRPVCEEFGATISIVDAFYTAPKEMVSFLTEFFHAPSRTQEGDRIFQFDVARNFALDQIPQEYDWVFWMDCDDVLVHGERLRELVTKAEQTGVEAYYFNYLYQVEMEGNQIKHVLIQHLRERLIRRGLFKWVAPIHETLIEQKGTQKEEADQIEVVHLATLEDRKQSLQRNLTSLELAIYRAKGKDPRQNYYLAKALYDLSTPQDDDLALTLILDHYLFGPDPSGWEEERGQAWQYVGEIYRRRKEHNNAIKAAMNAMIEDPENPAVFIHLAASYMLKQQWERALFWVRIATKIQMKKTTLVVNPKDIQARILEVIYNSCLNLSKVDEAWASAKKLVDLFPGDDEIKKHFLFIEMIRQQRELTKEVLHLAEYLGKTGEVAKVKALLASLPQTIQDNPFMVNLYKQHLPPTVWDEKSVVIYCGPGFTPWSPKQMKHPQGTFVGGSEEAVILMSEALTRQGWTVTVYGDPAGDEGEIDGVQWLPYYKFNGKDHFHILIGWRDVRFVDGNYDAQKLYLWLHDVQNPMDWTKERIDKITKVFFLSKWHRDNVPDLPEDKVMITSNGIPEDT